MYTPGDVQSAYEEMPSVSVSGSATPEELGQTAEGMRNQHPRVRAAKAKKGRTLLNGIYGE
jgi:hypothetical protein